jgi:hypothetical protein
VDKTAHLRPMYDFKNIFAEKIGKKVGFFDSKQSQTEK